MKSLGMLLLCLWTGAAHAVTNTNVVAFAELSVAPEAYKNKLVVYTAVYRNFLATPPAYMQSSGYREGKWLMLDVGHPQLPVFLKKTEENNRVVAALKPGSQVRVEGRVKAFRGQARRNALPDYCVEADAIILESGPPPMGGPPPRPGIRGGPMRLPFRQP